MVCGVSLKYAVLYDGDIAVGAFRYHITTVEDTFVTSHGLGLFRCHYVGKQVQGLDVAVKESGVFCGGEL